MVPALVTLLALLAINLWATRKVIALPRESGAPTRMLLAGIWLLPFFGALMVRIHAPRWAGEAGDRRAGGADPAAARAAGPAALPERIAGTGGAQFELGAHMALVHGLPILDWPALQAWASAHATLPAAAIDEGRRAWLLHLAAALGGRATLHVSEDACILSSLEPRVLQAASRYVSNAKRRIGRVLAELAGPLATERSLLIVFDDQHDYYRYVAIYYPDEGEFAFSSGMYIHAGCPHFCVVRADLAAIEPVIAHELTHSALQHLRLPKWLDEGIAVNTEHKLTGPPRLPHTPQELHAMHARYWSAERIQEFWSGRSFDRTDEGNLLSYELARIIVEQLARRWEPFVAFVRAARPEDGGAAAACEMLSISLGATAAALLEAGDAQDWEPAPAPAGASR